MDDNILIISSDLKTCRFLKNSLTHIGIHVYYGLTEKEGLLHLYKGHYNLVIIETNDCRLFGWELIPIIRKETIISILVISSSNKLEDKLKAFRLGADDYITKPFNIEELLARVKALLRRSSVTLSSAISTSVIMLDDLMVDFNYKIVFIKGERLDLTRKEFQLLYYLIANRGQVVSKEQIYQFVWKEEPFRSDNSVMCQIYNLRKKIEKNPSDPKYIQTVWGFGYRFLAG